MEVHEAQLGKYRGKKNKNLQFKIGERVRLRHQKDCFAKGYAPTFSEEVYAICDRKPNYLAPLYKLSDHLANPITGKVLCRGIATSFLICEHANTVMAAMPIINK